MDKVKILVVEDSEVTASLIQKSLERLGHEVSSLVTSGEEAIKKAEEDKPDLILMDIVLEGKMDGIETTGIIRSRFDIPVIYLTSHVEKKTLERAITTEPFGFITKPFEDIGIMSNIEMALYKHKAEKKLKKTNQEKQDKTRFLQLLQEITVIANEAPTTEKAIQVCLEKVCNYMNWPVGHVYITDSKGTLIPSKIWHIENVERFEVFRKVTEDTSFDPGVGLPGRVLTTGKPAWITDVTHDQNFPRAKLAKDIGIKAAFGLPVLEREKVVAVLEFFSDEAVEPDDSILEALSNLAVQVGRVTERKHIEEILLENEKMLRQLSEAAFEGIVIAEKGEILKCSEYFCSMFGYSLEELIGTTVLNLVKPEFRDIVSENIAKGYEGVYEVEALKKDGTEFPVEAHGVVAPYQGRIARVTAIRDITERKQAEEALKKSEKRYQQLFTNMLNGFAIHEIVVNEDNKPIDYIFLEVNDTFETMTGLKRGEIVGKKVTEVLPGIENDPADWIGVYGKVALTGEDARFEQHSEFLGKWYSVYSYRPQENQFAVIFEDITERKRAEEERKNIEEKLRQTQKLQSLGVLAGGIAHDFNNILTTILGNAELALDKLSPDSPLSNYVEEIRKGAKRAAELSQEMLAYSGKGKFAIKSIDVNELIEEITQMLNVSISKKHTIKYDLTENLPSVKVDITQIRQVIMNLIINGSEAIGENIGVISIATGAMECDKNYLKKMYLHDELSGGLYNFIEVADTGVGMGKDTIEKIFDPFFTTKFAGRGLGMSAVLGIIRGHKGNINIESEPGKGTKFTVFLPTSREASSTVKSGREEIATSWRGSGTVLVVDDEETVRDVGKSMLEKIGFNVITAGDGQEAVEIFRDRSNEIDGVLLDFTMPRMNGEESFIELRKIRKDIRVIMYSGYSEAATIQRFINQGVNEFLQKPFNLKTLRNKMRKVFENESR